MSALLLTNVVGRALPFQCTVLPDTNPLPLTVRSNAALPAMMFAGLSVAATGATFSIVNVTDDDVPPPGAGLTTVTCAVPALATSAAWIAAVSREPLTKVVARAAPFQLTVDPATK